jgi:hypothetical protein
VELVERGGERGDEIRRGRKKSDFIPTYLEGVDDGSEGVEEDHDHYSEGCDELRGTRHTTDTTKSYTTMS